MRVLSFACRRYPAAISRATLLRCQSSKAAAPAFDAETSRIYQIVSENHRHPQGPWNTMLDRVHAFCETHGPTFSILNLATGPGEPAATLARQSPQSTVVATNISPDQAALSQRLADTLPHMTVRVADMVDLSEFANESFDIVTCCYGFMFPSVIPTAIQEAHRVLKPHGQLIATTWNKASMMEKTRRIMGMVMENGQEPPPPSINPLSLQEPGLFESMLRNDGGFTKLQVSEYEYTFDLTNDPETQFRASTIPIKAFLDEHDAWDKAREAFHSIKEEYGGHDDNGHFILAGMEYKLVVASK